MASIPYIQRNFILVFTKAMKHSFGLYKAIPSVEVGSSKQAVSKIAQGQKLIGTSDCSGKQ